MTRGHVVLLGDSIFDNAAYVGEGPDVATQLRAKLGSGWTVTLRAVDGSISSDVTEQLRNLPHDTSHLVVSAGGNDILHHVALLGQSATSYEEVFTKFADLKERFAANHREMTDAVAITRKTAAICTIYDANHGAAFGRIVATALGMFNDAISRNVFAADLDLIDLRLVCTEGEHYANPIEPSVAGGAKIATAIADFVLHASSANQRSQIYR